jgi:3-deoxy-D-manno-octulosonic-acid transferase
MIRAFYSLLMWLAQPFLRRKLARRGQAEPGYLEAIEERFGNYADPAEPGMLWLHAVSLGETRAAAVLLDALRKREPGLRVLLTHGTATGRAEGQRLMRPGDAQSWLPWDTPGAVRDFLDHFRPRIGVLMETEVWPNLVAQCKARGVPLVLANARLSDKSLQQALQRCRPCRMRRLRARWQPCGHRRRPMPGGCANWVRRCRACWATSSSTPSQTRCYSRRAAPGAQRWVRRW